MISIWGYDKDFSDLSNYYGDIYKKFNRSSILVTGATGLLGSCLVEFLVYLKIIMKLDISVTVLSSSKQNVDARFRRFIDKKLIKTIIQDIRHPLPNDKNFDYIIHAASIANPKLYESTPVDVIDVTIIGTKNLLNYCKKNSKCRMLFVSSVEIYGDTATIQGDVAEDEYGAVNPFSVRSSYTESKRMAETLCKAYEAQFGVNCMVARLCKTYGPSNSLADARVMAFILNTILKNQDIYLNSDGSRIFSFCYVSDAVSALLLLLLKGRTGESYNISDKKSIASLKEIAQFSSQLANVSVYFSDSDGSIAISKDTVVNSSKLESLGWLPRTNIYQGLKKQYIGAKKHLENYVPNNPE